MKLGAISLALLSAQSVSAKLETNPFGAQTAQNTNSPKAKYLSRLLEKSRRLEDGDDAAAEEDEYMPDLTGYSVVFEKCQFMRRFADECDEDAGTCLETKSYALFKLCPDCDDCNYNYGEYMCNLDDYLQATTAYFQEKQEEECEWCEANCYYDEYAAADDAAAAGDDAADAEEDEYAEDEAEEEQDGDEDGERRKLQYYGGDKCMSCMSSCQKMQNMEANGYVDATNYLGCQQIYEDAYGEALYSGAMCGNSEGYKIKIGVFKDADCGVPTNYDVETYINKAQENGDDAAYGYGIRLSHGILKQVYNSGGCISCLVEEDDADNQGYYYNQDANNNQVLDICEEMYEASAKCETSNGFDQDRELSDNQAAQESMVCDMMSQLKSGTYDAITGEINLTGKSKMVSTSGATGGQKFALTLFILSTVGLAVYAAMLHQKLTRGSVGGLNANGGAMA